MYRIPCPRGGGKFVATLGENRRTNVSNLNLRTIPQDKSSLGAPISGLVKPPTNERPKCEGVQRVRLQNWRRIHRRTELWPSCFFLVLSLCECVSASLMGYRVDYSHTVASSSSFIRIMQYLAEKDDGRTRLQNNLQCSLEEDGWLELQLESPRGARSSWSQSP